MVSKMSSLLVSLSFEFIDIAPPAISTAPSLCINYDESLLDVSWSVSNK